MEGVPGPQGERHHLGSTSQHTSGSVLREHRATKRASRGWFRGAPLLLSQGIFPKPQSPLGGCPQPPASSMFHDLKIPLLIPRGTTLVTRGYRENTVLSPCCLSSHRCYRGCRVRPRLASSACHRPASDHGGSQSTGCALVQDRFLVWRTLLVE